MKVLLADANPDRARSVKQRLIDARAVEVICLRPGEKLAQAVRTHAPDVVIVDMARPDRDSLEGIREVSSHDPRPIVMFVDRDDHAFMEEAIAAGVSSYNIVGSAVPDVKPIVQAAVAMFRRYQKIAGELRQAETTINEQRIIQRAKIILMQERKVGEPQAHRWLRKQAMDRGKRIAEVAAELLETSRKET